MADYYTNISFAFEVTEEQAAAFEAANDMRWEEFAEIDLPPALGPFMTLEELQEICEGDAEVHFGDVEFERMDTLMVIHGSNPDLERIALLVQAIMKPEKPIGFQWSNDCSKHRIDAFGGGCCAIFKDRIEFESTATRLDAMLNG